MAIRFCQKIKLNQKYQTGNQLNENNRTTFCHILSCPRGLEQFLPYRWITRGHRVVWYVNYMLCNFTVTRHNPNHQLWNVLTQHAGQSSLLDVCQKTSRENISAGKWSITSQDTFFIFWGGGPPRIKLHVSCF